MMYASDKERAIETPGIGFSLVHRQHGSVVKSRLLALAYANDLILVTDSVEDM